MLSDVVVVSFGRPAMAQVETKCNVVDIALQQVM